MRFSPGLLVGGICWLSTGGGVDISKLLLIMFIIAVVDGMFGFTSYEVPKVKTTRKYAPNK